MAIRKGGSKRSASKKPVTPKPAGETRTYELAVVVSSTVKAEQRNGVLQALTKTVEKAQGQVGRIDEIGLRDLAYPIRSERTGWYASLALSLPPEALSAVDGEVRRDEKILRHLLMRAI